ncbi:alanine racemase [Candidatus Uhrbacteria bacterium]|nr:alanine racemase [Candidatus Uhrbacteria bacterium]
MKSWVEISRSNITHNLREFDRNLPSGVRFMAVVKSNAYGHGAREVAHIISKNAPKKRELWLGADSVEEGVLLRKSGVKLPILVLGYSPKEDLTYALRHNLRLTVYNAETIRALSSSASVVGKIANVHIKVDTGATRQGIGEKEAVKFCSAAAALKNIKIEGVSTHFANIEDTLNHSYAGEQHKRFMAVLKSLKSAGLQIPVIHTAASAATILFPETHFNMVRVGLSLYGLWPSAETKISAKTRVKDFNLRPVLCWKTIIAQIRQVSAGTPVSYGLTERVTRASKVAVLPIGYFDGYDRRLSSLGNVLIRGVKCKILGRVCMNMVMADVTDVPGVKIEDEAVLLGRQKKEQITAEEIAQKIGTINYEVVSRINPNLQRIAV